MAKELHSEIVTIRLTPSGRRLVTKLAEREERSVSGTIRCLIRIGLREMGLDAMQAQVEREARGDA